MSPSSRMPKPPTAGPGASVGVWMPSPAARTSAEKDVVEP